MRSIRIFLFLAGVLVVLFGIKAPIQAEEAPLPHDRVIQQQTVWKGYSLELITSPAKPLPLDPLDIYLRIQKEGVPIPFPGTISVGFENPAEKNAPFQETALTPADAEGPGLARITHIFQTPGVYGITVTLTDLEGNLAVLRGKVEVISEGLSPKLKMILVVFSALSIVLIILYKVRSSRRPF